MRDGVPYGRIIVLSVRICRLDPPDQTEKVALEIAARDAHPALEERAAGLDQVVFVDIFADRSSEIDPVTISLERCSPFPVDLRGAASLQETGSASWRERVCPYV